MRALILTLLVLPACSLLPDGSRAVSVAGARAAIEGAADDIDMADLNGDGMIQLDSNSGAPIAALQAYLRANAAGVEALDRNADGKVDSRELLGAAPMMAARLYAASGSMSPRPADGNASELAMLGILLADRLSSAMR